ncbi:MAG: DUF2911 domain-containing protein [Longimicrobiales bacterium]|nr:DUF2911 domain-containing protein [Longimicrobiales bacterium]
MKRRSWSLLATMAVALGVATLAPKDALAQEPACEPQAEVEDRASPYDSVSMAVGDGVVKVCYSRPSLRGRTMIGGDAVPYGQVWRTGANEPTTLHATVPVSIAGIEVGPGSYSLYTIPREAEDWTLIVNASTSQWGHESGYPDVEDQDVGRTTVTMQALDSTVEQFTIRAAEDGGALVLEWQNSRVYVPITADGS